MLELTYNKIDVARCAQTLHDARAGALASFEGRVRNHHLGRPVAALSYEAAPALAMREFGKIIDESKGQLAVLDVLCIHRLGHLDVGETAIWLGVLAPHRKEAFVACERIMHELKSRLPIWKNEFFSDGSEAWVDDPCGCVHPS